MQQDQDMMKQNQDLRLKPMQGDQSQQQAPQKCPRCESPKTKFCYYNNYSLSQPRYFCKTCRRYWTQGGTLRNVPVGGGCRKGKRMKTSSASTTTTASSSSSTDNSRSKPLVTSTQNVTTTSTNSGSSVSVGLRTKEEPRTLTSVAPAIYSSSGGGFLMSSLAAIQSLNNQAQPYPLNHQPVNLGRDFGSNLSLLRGFNAGVPSFGQSYHVGGRDNSSTGDPPFYATSSYHHHPQQQNWQQPTAGFISSNTNTSTGCDTGLWSSSITTPTGNTDPTNTENDASFPSNLTDQWHHDLPGYGPSL